ncbi:hypothetical protein NPIL_627521 [Nephila pilipes]|uniref:Uncharacterized protein n=1 Tax=Nephila pilipes TaxID=299642 RepID=A0A8X6N6D0_NEPPI|nr:hypothetical protein NPIL_627521 [Nephila pilipes]
MISLSSYFSCVGNELPVVRIKTNEGVTPVGARVPILKGVHGNRSTEWRVVVRAYHLRSSTCVRLEPVSGGDTVGKLWIVLSASYIRLREHGKAVVKITNFVAVDVQTEYKNSEYRKKNPIFTTKSDESNKINGGYYMINGTGSQSPH